MAPFCQENVYNGVWCVQWSMMCTMKYDVYNGYDVYNRECVQWGIPHCTHNSPLCTMGMMSTVGNDVYNEVCV